MNCTEFRQWLDRDRPERDSAAMILHAANCADCDRELRAGAEVDRLLRVVVPAEVRADFNDSVMRRIRWSRAMTAILSAFAEPIVPIAAALLSIIAWQFEAIVRSVTNAQVPVGFAIALAPVIFWISWRLFRSCERMID